MSIRRLGALAAFAVIVAGCGTTENKIILPSPTPTPAPTLAPIASVASSSVSAVIGTAVSLDGTPSTDPQGGALAFAWEMLVRPDASDAVLAGADTSTPTFTPDVVGDYVVKLVVVDTAGLESAPAYVDVNAATCGSAAPTIGALSATAVDSPPAMGDLVSLSAANVSDPNAACGTLTQPLTYEWTLFSQPAASNAQLSSPASATPTFVADVAGGTYTFALTVTDALGNQSATALLGVATSSCGANRPVVTSAIFAGSPSVGAGADLTATAASADNTACPARFAVTLSYSWSIDSTPAGAHASLSSTTLAATHLSTDTPGTHVASVVAVASNGLTSAPMSVSVPVGACGTFPPVAGDFQASQSIAGGFLSDTVTAGGGVVSSGKNWYAGVPMSVAAFAVTDADQTSCGLPAQPFTYSWSLVTAPPGSTATVSGSSVFASFVPDVAGIYEVAATTRDDRGDASTSTLILQVACGASAPVINGLQTIQDVGFTVLQPPAFLAVGYPVGFSVSAGDVDSGANAVCQLSEPQPLTYRWSLVAQPPGSKATMLASDEVTPSFVPDVAGVYQVALTVTDPQGHATQAAPVTLDVVCNSAPPAIATVGGSNIPDWHATQTVSVNGGQSLFQVRASNGSADFASLGVLVPFYPGAPVGLLANVSTAPTPGCPVFPSSFGYAWKIASQPAGSTATLNNPTAQNPSFTPDLPGAYAFQLQLTDSNSGRSSTTLLSNDTLGATVVNVGSCGTNPPTAAASITAPFAATSFPANEPLGSTVALDASGSLAPDAISYPAGCGLTLPLSYRWAFTAKPAGSTAALDDPQLVNPSFVPDQLGTYGLSLAVSDGVHTTTKALSVIATIATSRPGPSGAVFTSTAADASGNPVAAWWDNVNGVVAAARCTANCDKTTATWSSLGTIDSGLTTQLTFAPSDEPRPVAVAVNGSDIWVAYFTGRGTAPTTGVHGVTTCNVALAHWNGTAWVSWTTVPNAFVGSGFACTAGGAPPYSNYEFGRWLSIALVSGKPNIAMWSVVGNPNTEVEVVSCSDTSCGSMSAVRVDPIPSHVVGRWASLVTDPGGFLDLAYADDDLAGNTRLRFASNRSGSFVASTVDAGSDVGRFASLAFANGTTNLMVAYRDGVLRDVKLASCALNATGCSFGAPTLVPDASSTDYGYSIALASDASGGPRLGFGESGGVGRLFSAANPSASTGFTSLGLIATGGSGANSPFGLSACFASSHGMFTFNGGVSGPVEFAETP